MNKKQKTEKCQAILKKYSLNEPILEEYDFLIDLFKGHQGWLIKNGLGIKSIHVGNTKYGNRCFYITRIDDSITDISYIQCIKGKKQTDLEKIKHACRSAIVPIIKKYRDNNVVYGKTTCAVSNEILLEGMTDIDHYDMTFIEMFNLWIQNYDLSNLVQKLNIHKDMCHEWYFVDNEIKDEFIKFHNAHCKLRAVTKYVNQVLLRKNDIPF
jgi:hypothetical protein